MFLLRTLRIGTRSSKLALWQAEFVAEKLKKLGFKTEIVPIKTEGDRIKKPLYQFGGKGLFVKEIEKILLDKRVDIAVHSLKDMSVFEDEPFDFVVLERDYHQDTFVSFKGNLLELEKPKIGTTSLRRRAEILRIKPDAEFVDLRGNLDTRLSKLKDGEVDGIVVSKSGLMRLDLYDETCMYDLEVITPAAGQGVVAIEFLRDFEFKEQIESLEDKKTRLCIDAERTFVRELNASCNYPIGAHAYFENEEFCMRVMYGFVDDLKKVIRYLRCDRSMLFVLADVMDYVKKKVKEYESRNK
ncbi:hydroxymethylbilane synthase [Hippea alviniae]|uniref:hydroxymethylbilane synthase n=1 Tax=Hippea alviniae TaxID=1279027 RepID=UPI0003B63AFB|nr:hydroxymethylbilane synthase [Hippea alviniae]